MAPTISKISEPAFKVSIRSPSIPYISDQSLPKVTSGALVGFVLLAAGARIALQVKNRRRLFLSDVCLLLACACLCAATVMFYFLCDDLYLDEALVVDPASVVIPPDFLEKATYSIQLLFAFQTVMWTVIFLVKASFLSFFRPLIRRLPRLKAWWTLVTMGTALVWAFCASDVYIICRYFGLSSRESLYPLRYV